MGQAAIPIAVAVAAAVAGAGAAAVLAPTPKAVSATPPVTRNAAAEFAMRDRDLRLRRGAGANEITGGGAEAPSTGGKTLLGQ